MSLLKLILVCALVFALGYCEPVPEATHNIIGNQNTVSIAHFRSRFTLRYIAAVRACLIEV